MKYKLGSVLCGKADATDLFIIIDSSKRTHYYTLYSVEYNEKTEWNDWEIKNTFDTVCEP